MPPDLWISIEHEIRPLLIKSPRGRKKPFGKAIFFSSLSENAKAGPTGININGAKPIWRSVTK